VWLRAGGKRANPTEKAWLTQAFPFHDASGKVVNLTPEQVLDTTKAPLSYIYDEEL
jgi:hypothetical protein